MRFTDSPYEDFMKEKSYFKGVPPNLPPKGSRCDGCLYWHSSGSAVDISIAVCISVILLR